jgi:hypothetical protein
MSTETREGSVFVKGTNFVVQPVEVAWKHSHPCVLGFDPDVLDSDVLSRGGLFEEFFGDERDPDDRNGRGLPGDPRADANPEKEFRRAWLPQHKPTGMRCPLLWRQADAEYVARQVYDACPEVWNLPDRRACRQGIPERVGKWLRLVPRLLNRGVPRDLLVGCYEYAGPALTV